MWSRNTERVVSCSDSPLCGSMAGFQIPIEIKFDFLQNIVIPFFGVTLDSSQTRTDWMRDNAKDFYGHKLEALIRSSNFIISLDQAVHELREERERVELREERERIRKERVELREERERVELREERERDRERVELREERERERVELREERERDRERVELREEREIVGLREERAFILQQQLAGTIAILIHHLH
jgi:hypothetical protein